MLILLYLLVAEVIVMALCGFVLFNILTTVIITMMLYGLGYVTLPYLIPAFCTWLAGEPKDDHYGEAGHGRNRFFTLVADGYCRVPVTTAGADPRIIYEYEGHVRGSDGKIRELTQPEKDAKHTTFGKLSWFQKKYQRNMRGIHWIGIPLVHRLHEERKKWDSWEQVSDGNSSTGGTRKVVPQNKVFNAFLLRPSIQLYIIGGSDSRDIGVETRDRIPHQIELNATISIEDPHKALFGIEHWTELVDTRLRKGVTEWIRKLTLSQLFQDQRSKQRSIANISKHLFKACKDIIDDIKTFGILVTELDIISIDPVGKHAEDIRKAFQAITLAMQQKEADVVQSEGQKEVLENLAKGHMAHFAEVFSLATNQTPTVNQIINYQAQRVKGDLKNLNTLVEAGAIQPLTLPIPPPPTPPVPTPTP